MNTLSKSRGAGFRCGLMPALAGVTPKPKLYAGQQAMKQRGVVLFFALIALVVISLAAVALIRSVDTSTMIAGNLAFKQSATASGDAGIETAIDWLNRKQFDMKSIGKDVYKHEVHTFNNTNAAEGYYSNADPTLCLTCDAVWDAIDPSLTFTDMAGNVRPIVVTDSSGNTVRFVIQRMCRNAYPGLDVRNIPDVTNCLFSSANLDKDGKEVKKPQDMCPPGGGCPSVGQTPQLRITIRITGPKNTVSFIQSFVN